MASERPERGIRDTAFALAGIGMLNAVAVLCGGVLGWLLDQAVDTTPVFLLIGGVLGLSLGVLATWGRVRTYLGN